MRCDSADDTQSARSNAHNFGHKLAHRNFATLPLPMRVESGDSMAGSKAERIADGMAGRNGGRNGGIDKTGWRHDWRQIPRNIDETVRS